MGVGVHSAIHLFKLADRGIFQGELLTLGTQDTHLTVEKLNELAHTYRLPAPPHAWKHQINDREPYKSGRFITGDSLWRYLGFKSITALDVSDYENANLRIDLNNKGAISQEHKNKYQVVFDGGTVEHIFHLPNALANLHDLTKEGGVIIHQTPSLPLIDHGFYMFSPTFFHDYYSANGYETMDLKLVMYSVNSETEPCWFMDYTPGCLGWVSNKGWCFPGMNFLVLGAFKKLPGSRCDVVPQQGAYVHHWKVALDKRLAEQKTAK